MTDYRFTHLGTSFTISCRGSHTLQLNYDQKDLVVELQRFTEWHKACGSTRHLKSLDTCTFRQLEMARNFSRKYNITTDLALKYLDWMFDFQKGILTADAIKDETGIEILWGEGGL